MPSNNEAKSDTNANGGEEKDADKHMSDAAEYSPMSPIVQPVVVSINEGMCVNVYKYLIRHKILLKLAIVQYDYRVRYRKYTNTLQKSQIL